MFSLILVLTVASPVSPLAEPAGANDAVPDLRPGMTGEQVRRLLGPPGRVSRQGVLMLSLEQWHYGPPHRLRLGFAQPRGRHPSLTVIRSQP